MSAPMPMLPPQGYPFQAVSSPVPYPVPMPMQPPPPPMPNANAGISLWGWSSIGDLRRKVFVFSFNSVLQKVYELCRTEENQLTISNLPPLPVELQSSYSVKSFKHTFSSPKKTNLPGVVPRITVIPLIKQIVLKCGIDVLKTGVLKLFLCGLSFASPILLGLIVSYLGDDGGPSNSNISYGLALIALLAACSILSAALNTNFNIRSWVIKCRLIGALSPLIFARSLA
eukprot:gene2458-3324_t